MTGNKHGDIAITRIAVYHEFDVRVTLFSIDKKDWRVAREQTHRKEGTSPTTQFWSDYEVQRHVTFFNGRVHAAHKFYSECVEEMTRIFGNGRMYFHGGTA